MIWTDGDAILKHSLYFFGEKLRHTSRGSHITDLFFSKPCYEYYDMVEKCQMNNILFQRKSPTYRWSNSGSENPAENTLLKRPTWWIYHKILKHIGWDPYKGANFDQLRAYWLTLYATRSRKAAFKHLLGFVLRLGFAPSFMEHVFFKPQATVALLATIWEPLKYLVWIPFKLSALKNLNIPISESTTNKITLIPTLMLLEPNTHIIHLYYELVYKTYFHQFDNRIVGNAMIVGLKTLEVQG